MKQEMKSFLETIKEEIFSLSKNLNKNYKESLPHYKSCSYIIDILRKYNFTVEENYLQIPSAFYAAAGSGHPKICYVCELDITKYGYEAGNNISVSISVAAALALSKIISKTSGTVILIGCPSEHLNNFTLHNVRNKLFDDIDAAFMGCPYIINAENGRSENIVAASRELISSQLLSRLFFHNFKECGVINISDTKASMGSAGIFSLSHEVPFIYPCISLVEDASVQYPSEEFALSTVSHFAEDRAIKAAEAFAFTGYDLINNNNLLSEAKTEFYKNFEQIR